MDDTDVGDIRALVAEQKKKNGPPEPTTLRMYVLIILNLNTDTYLATEEPNASTDKKNTRSN
jgi:hypothetical protein